LLGCHLNDYIATRCHQVLPENESKKTKPETEKASLDDVVSTLVSSHAFLNVFLNHES
jgi:hypothetical protein